MSYNLLQGKKGLIFGALDEKSLAWQVALKAKEEGASFVLTNAPVGIRLGQAKELAAQCNAELIPADATSLEDLENLFKKTNEILGGKVDFILHSIGMSLNLRKNRPYTDLNYDFLQKTLDISAISFHKVIQTCMKLDSINEWGSILALSYIAANKVFPGYNDMADAKALLESITRNFGYQYGEKKKVRINTISQSPTLTTAGSGIEGFNEFFDYSAKMSPLGNASAKSCADFCVLMFSDLSRMVTMQNIYHDGGFSSMGIAPGVLK